MAGMHQPVHASTVDTLGELQGESSTRAGQPLDGAHHIANQRAQAAVPWSATSHGSVRIYVYDSTNGPVDLIKELTSLPTA